MSAPYRDDTSILASRLDEVTRDLAALEASERLRVALEAEAKELRKRLAERDPFANARIASPCTASWEDMVGNDRVRFCGHCAKNVYDVRAMTSAEARILLKQSTEGPCVRIFRRQDGTVLTDDCPVGSRRKNRRLAIVGVGAAATMVGFAASSFAVSRPMMGKMVDDDTIVSAGEAVVTGTTSSAAAPARPPSMTPEAAPEALTTPAPSAAPTASPAPPGSPAGAPKSR